MKSKLNKKLNKESGVIESGVITLVQVKTIDPYEVKGYVIKHTVDVYVSSDEIKNHIMDEYDLSLMLSIFNLVAEHYDSSEHRYSYSFGKVSRNNSGAYFRVFVSDKRS